MLHIKTYIKENISMLIVLICFLFVAVFNTFMNIGLIEDGCHHFWEALVADNIWIGHEGFNSFPFNSRYFPSIVQHLSVGFLAFLGITNIKVLLFVFTLVSYLLPIMILLIIYLNIPKEKRNCFEIILLYFLICTNFMIYQIWTENFLTGLFLWVIFVIYYYNDFDKLSKFNLISLILFSFLLISSHPMTAVFVIPMIIFAMVKQYKTDKGSNLTNIILALSYILLFIAFGFNLYYIFEPIYPKDDYILFKFFREKTFIYFFISILFVLMISLVKINNKKIKILFNIIYYLICLGMLFIVLFGIHSFDGFMYRVLGFYVPLFLMIFILFKDFFKFVIDYKNIKILNFLLIFIFLFHSFYYGILWNRYIINIKNTMMTNQTINLVQITEYELFHNHNLPCIIVIVPVLFNFEQNCKIIMQKNNLLYKRMRNMGIYKKNLSKFNIKLIDCQLSN